MKSFTIIGLSLLASITDAQANSTSTVVCAACKPASSTPDIVTRSPVPSTSCTAPALITVPIATGGTGSAAGNPTASLSPPVAAASNHGAFIGASGMIALAMGVAVLA